MSLFGSGRRDGVLAVVALVVTALAVHALGGYLGLGDGFEGDRALAAAMGTAHRLFAAGELPLWDPSGNGAPIWAREGNLMYPPWWLLGRGHDELWLPALTALHTALACALAFRFLRAQGRSRYAAFVAGAAYGLGAHVGSLAGNLGELAALAWAPLSIEILMRAIRGHQNRHYVALLGPALTIPFLTGGVVTATAVTTLVVVSLLHTTHREPSRRLHLLGMGAGALTVVALVTAPLWLGAWETPPMPGAPAVPPAPADLLEPLRRVAGPLLLFLAILGIFRGQREAPTSRWLVVMTLTAALALLLPYVPSPLPGPAPWQRTPTALWWTAHLSLVLLAASGLDDFLHRPLRRRAATAWTMLLAMLAAPLVYALGPDQTFLHVEAAVLLALAALFGAWRSLGILGFKTVLGAAALVWLAAATLFEQARAARDPAPVYAVQPRVDGTLHGPLSGSVPPAPVVEVRAPLRLPERARIAFELRADDTPTGGSGAGAAIAGLPRDFQTVPDATAAVDLRAEGALWSEYDVDMGTGRGALIVDDTFARGWQVQVNGDPQAILRANGCARAVLLGPGTHLVRFDYRPMTWWLGSRCALAGAGLSALLALLALLARLFRR